MTLDMVASGRDRATATGRGDRGRVRPAVALMAGWGSPTDGHVRLDRLAGAFQVGARLLHIEPDGVELVPGGAGQAVAGGGAGVDLAGDAQHRLGDDPGVARAVVYPEHLLGGVVGGREGARGRLVGDAGDHDMCRSLHLE